MQHLDTLVVAAELRASVRRLVDRLGTVKVQSDRRWQKVVDQLDFGSANELSAVAGTAVPVVVVGSPADIVKHARHATDEFGFVMPVAHLARFGRRARSWRDDATLELWHAGWSPLNIDRIVVPMRSATVEFAIGDACPIPEVQVRSDEESAG